MIVDCVALLAARYREPDAARCKRALAEAANCRMSVANPLATAIVVESRCR